MGDLQIGTRFAWRAGREVFGQGQKHMMKVDGFRDMPVHAS